MPRDVTTRLVTTKRGSRSTARRTKVDIHDGVVQQGNFNDYRMVRLAQAPRVEAEIVRSERAPGGVGEPGVPPLAPAVCNALFQLTGQRVRSLPLVS